MTSSELIRPSIYGKIALARSLAFLALGVFISLSTDHSARLGLVVFAVFAVLVSAANLWLALSAVRTPVIRGALLVAAVAGAVIAALALLLPPQSVSLVVMVSAFALVLAATDAVTAFAARGRSSALTRDGWTLAALHIALVVVLLVVPQNFVETYTHIDRSGITRSQTLTTDIVLVGIVGAWAILIGVFQVIAALTMRWQAAEQRLPQVEPGRRAVGES